MRTSTPWLATILPVLNEEGHIGACLQSLLCQSIPSDEHMIVVLDGGSTDRTKEIVQAIQDGLKHDEQPMSLLCFCFCKHKGLWIYHVFG